MSDDEFVVDEDLSEVDVDELTFGPQALQSFKNMEVLLTKIAKDTGDVGDAAVIRLEQAEHGDRSSNRQFWIGLLVGAAIGILGIVTAILIAMSQTN